MSKDGPDKDNKVHQAATPHAIEVRRIEALELRRQGLKVQEIADRMGVERTTISRYLNSQTVKEIVREAKKNLKTLLLPSIGVYAKAINKAEEDPGNARLCARDILKNFGVLRDEMDLNHNFPKPTVIRRKDGSELVLGAKNEDEDKKELDE